MPGGVEGGGEKPPPIRLNCGGYNVGNEDIMVRRNDKSDCGMLQDQRGVSELLRREHGSKASGNGYVRSAARKIMIPGGHFERRKRPDGPPGTRPGGETG